MCGVPVWSLSVCAVFQLARQHFRRLAAAACAAGWTVPGSASEPPALCSEPDGAPRTHSGNARLVPEHTHTYVMKVFSMQVCVCVLPHHSARLLPESFPQIGHLQPQAPPLHLCRMQPLAEDQEMLLEDRHQTLLAHRGQRSAEGDSFSDKIEFLLCLATFVSDCKDVRLLRPSLIRLLSVSSFTPQDDRLDSDWSRRRSRRRDKPAQATESKSGGDESRETKETRCF